MKSKDLIKIIKEEDPTGENHVRVPGGAVSFVERKEGYYDGPYVYKNKDGALVLTDIGDKIDIHTESIEERIWDCEGNLDRIKDEVIIDLQNDHKDYWKTVVIPEAKKCRKAQKASLEEFTFYVLEKVLKEGCIITQPSDTVVGQYNKMWFEKKDKKEKLRQGDCGAVIKSGFFKAKPDYDKNRIIWELIK